MKNTAGMIKLPNEILTISIHIDNIFPLHYSHWHDLIQFPNISNESMFHNLHEKKSFKKYTSPQYITK